LYGLPGITAGSIGHVVGLRDIRIYSMGWLTADVDLVIDSAYQARMSYTYATGIAMNIGGTNQNPSGTDPMTDPTVTPGNGNSNSDWQWDAGLGHHVPLTGLAKVFVLANDPFGEGFNTWVITY
jgi:hypothetical protein